MSSLAPSLVLTPFSFQIDDGKTTDDKEKDEEKEKSMQQQVQLEVDLKLNQVGFVCLRENID